MSKNRPPSWTPDWLSPIETSHVEASSSNVANSSRHTSDKGEDEVEMVQSPQQNIAAQQVNAAPEFDVTPEQGPALSSVPAVYIEHDRDRDVKYVSESSIFTTLLTTCFTDAV
jgi:hypothetical protein